jgi:NADH-quinone oxidoreductase subunit J
MDGILFLIFAAIAVASGVSVVVQRHPIASALSLIGVMVALAALYLLLGAQFIAAAQLVVYAGAIMVLFVFVIMLLNSGAEARTSSGSWARFLGVPLLTLFLGLVSFVIQTQFSGAGNVAFENFTQGGGREIGLRLFRFYLLPFEVTSVLILIAILGAIVLARKEIDQ